MTKIPKLSKIVKNNDVYVERVLPKEGKLNVKVGMKTEPFTKMGVTKVSYGKLPINDSFRLESKKRVGDFFYTGDTVGYVRGKKVIAPFDGRIEKVENNYLYKQDERDFWLLAGVWGEIVGVVKRRSVLLKTQTTDLHLAAYTKISYSGELIVFPNPSKILELQYLEKFLKDSFGKIIYLGDHVDVPAVEKAVNLGVAGLLAGSAAREAFSLAKENEMFLGVFSGFGEVPTPKPIYEFLNDISNRFVLLQGSRGVVRVPNPERFSENETTSDNQDLLVELREGLRVQVLKYPEFGQVGTVQKIDDNGQIYVKLDQKAKPVQVQIPNILALE